MEFLINALISSNRGAGLGGGLHSWRECFNYSIYLYLYMCSLNKLYIVYLIANVVNIGHSNSCYLVIYLRDVISSLNEILNMTEM